ncbi:MAG: porin [Gammaproteobacteria bacterium]|nr:porin [Gammaproteobacteria bacterium]
MNKKLLAIAVGAAMVAGSTAVMAADEPTIYAKIHLSVDSMDNGGTGDAADGLFVSSNSSRLGIKGAVDLDGGMKAVYKYEMSTNYSTASGGLAGNRNAYLGLKGGFGQIIAGRHDMPFKTVGRKADLFGDTIGDHRTVTRAKVGGDDYADRRDNVLMYSNSFGAVDLAVAYAPEETGKDNTDMSIGIDFKQGPLKVMFAHEVHGGGNLTTNNDSTGDIITGAYKMNEMTFLAGYGQVSDLDGDKGDAGQVTMMTLGGSMKAGMNTFKLQYTMAESDVSDTASALLALGVDHKLGKNTSVYAMYAAISNDDLAGAGFTNSGHDSTVAAVTGEDASGFSLGMIHKF